MNATAPDVDEDLPWSARFLLWTLEEHEGSTTRATLLERTEMPPRTLDRGLDRLEAAGVIRRDRDGQDLRFVHIEIVEKS